MQAAGDQEGDQAYFTVFCCRLFYFDLGGVTRLFSSPHRVSLNGGKSAHHSFLFNSLTKMVKPIIALVGGLAAPAVFAQPSPQPTQSPGAPPKCVSQIDIRLFTTLSWCLSGTTGDNCSARRGLPVLPARDGIIRPVVNIWRTQRVVYHQSISTYLQLHFRQSEGSHVRPCTDVQLFRVSRA